MSFWHQTINGRPLIRAARFRSFHDQGVQNLALKISFDAQKQSNYAKSRAKYSSEIFSATMRDARFFPAYVKSPASAKTIASPVIVVCPKTGRLEKQESTSRKLICVSFHLKIKVPPGFKTLQHSSNPFDKSSLHVSLLRLPYFFFIQDVSSACKRCGGSKQIRKKDSSGKGNLRKSHTVSGFTSKTLLLNQSIFPPQHGSRT